MRLLLGRRPLEVPVDQTGVQYSIRRRAHKKPSISLEFLLVETLLLYTPRLDRFEDIQSIGLGPRNVQDSFGFGFIQFGLTGNENTFSARTPCHHGH
jgi:hypothetical protein